MHKSVSAILFEVVLNKKLIKQFQDCIFTIPSSCSSVSSCMSSTLASSSSSSSSLTSAAPRFAFGFFGRPSLRDVSILSSSLVSSTDAWWLFPFAFAFVVALVFLAGSVGFLGSALTMTWLPDVVEIEFPDLACWSFLRLTASAWTLSSEVNFGLSVLFRAVCVVSDGGTGLLKAGILRQVFLSITI